MRTNQAFGLSWSKEDSRRSLLLCATGAIVGLTLAGFSLFTAKSSSVGYVPPENIAMVNRRPILRSDFLTQTQVETGLSFNETTAEQRQKVLSEMIEEELLVQRGLEVDLAAADPDVRTALVAGVNLQVDAEVLAKQPSELELQSYFDQHRDKYTAEGTMQIRDLIAPLVSDLPLETILETTQYAATAISKGASIDAIMTAYGLKDSGLIDQRANFDFAVAAKLGEDLYRIATSLAAGEVSRPVRQSDGVHILVMLDRKLPPAVDFLATRDRVWQDVQREARYQVEQANIDYLRSKAEILLAPEYRQGAERP
jgi:hypothetical protein